MNKRTILWILGVLALVCILTGLIALAFTQTVTVYKVRTTVETTSPPHIISAQKCINVTENMQITVPARHTLAYGAGIWSVDGIIVASGVAAEDSPFHACGSSEIIDLIERTLCATDEDGNLFCNTPGDYTSPVVTR